MTAATCASDGVLHDGDRPIRRLAPVPFDDLADRALFDAEHRGEHRDRAIHVLGVLADDRDAVRVAVLDQHAPVAVEEHAARRTQRQASAGGCSRPSPGTSSCCTTCSTQKLTASTENSTMVRYWSTLSRTPTRRRSSWKAIRKILARIRSNSRSPQAIANSTRTHTDLIGEARIRPSGAVRPLPAGTRRT